MANTWHHDRKRYHPWDNPRAENKVLDKFRRERWWYLICGERVYGRRTFHYTDYGAAGPRWFRNVFMERPARREAKRLEQAAVRGADIDALAWPQAKKPTVYYW